MTEKRMLTLQDLQILAATAERGDGAVTEKRMLTLQDLQILAATAERNGTSHNFVKVALQWAAGAQAEVERLTSALKEANDRAEHFERRWHLTAEDAARYAFAKTLEGQVVTMETFKVRGSAELDQALDDAMLEARKEKGL